MGEYSRTYERMAEIQVELKQNSFQKSVALSRIEQINFLMEEHRFNSVWKGKDFDEAYMKSLKQEKEDMFEHLERLDEIRGDLEVAYGECQGYISELNSIDGQE